MAIGCSEGTLIERIAEANTIKNPVDFIGCEVNPAFQRGWSNPEGEFHSYVSNKTKMENGDLVIDPDMPKIIHDRFEKTIAHSGDGNVEFGFIKLVCTDILDWSG